MSEEAEGAMNAEPHSHSPTEPTARKLEGFDRVFPLIGGHHRYQWMLLFITAMTGISAFHHMGYAFLGAMPDHWCRIPELEDVEWTAEQIKNISIPQRTTLKGALVYDSCSYYDLNYDYIKSEPSYQYALMSIDFGMTNTLPCTEWVYDTSVYESTTVTEFNLVCERKYLVATIQATYMAGVFVGFLVLGALSDRILGRRGCLLICAVLIISGGFGAGLAPSYALFVLFRFIVAIGVAGSFQNAFTVLMEYCDAPSRAAFGFMQWVPFAIFYMVMALYAYLLRNWRHLQFAFSASTLVLVSFFWILPESSRWLASKNRKEEAIEILEKIAKMNKFPPPKREELEAIMETCGDKIKPSTTTEGQILEISTVRRAFTGFKMLCKNYVNLVRTQELRRRSLILWFLFISVTLVYYGISFASPSLSNDPFLVVFLGGLAEFPGYIGAIPLASKWGRKPAMVVTYLVSGLACGAVAFLPKDFIWIRVTLSMIGKMFITGTFAVIYLLGAELYPTEERATGLGAGALMGRVGSIAAPYVALMRTVYEDLPSIVFAIAALLSAIVSLLLPETKDAEMLEHVDEVEEVAERIRRESQNADTIGTTFKNFRDSFKLKERSGGRRKSSSTSPTNEDGQTASKA